jgi:hypothetical protein
MKEEKEMEEGRGIEMRKEGIEFFDLDPRQEELVRDFTKEVSYIKVTDTLSLLTESTETLEKARRFIMQNPEMVAKMIQKVNKNPEVIARLDKRAYDYLKERYPIENKEYYVPPLAVVDPMDPVAVLPAALAVAVIACFLMFVGRGGLRGVV